MPLINKGGRTRAVSDPGFNMARSKSLIDIQNPGRDPLKFTTRHEQIHASPHVTLSMAGIMKSTATGGWRGERDVLHHVHVRGGPAFRDRTLVCETGSAKMAAGGNRQAGKQLAGGLG